MYSSQIDCSAIIEQAKAIVKDNKLDDGAFIGHKEWREGGDDEFNSFLLFLR